jgi:two-component system, chemotaxis family, protein-glutamate methylesterase/glutaminase
MTKGPDAIRVLIVDDSAVIRGALGRIVDGEPDLRVVTTAPNGKVALDALRHAPIDVVLLDIEMPEMNGLTVLPLILAQYPATRVIMASSLTQSGAEVTMQALALGAADYIAKPSARAGSATLAAISTEIASKVRAIGRAARGHRSAGPIRAVSVAPLSAAAVCAPVRTELLSSRAGGTPRVIAIASSTGGPNALSDVLTALPRDFAVPILITQHMPAVFTALLAQRLERDTGRTCVEATDGTMIVPGTTYVAPGGFHMIVQTDEGQPYIRLTETEPENFCRPAADPMLRSIAAIYGASTLAVVLTGMGEDGLRGCREVQQRGGRLLVQDEATSVVWGMPGAVANAGLGAAVVPLPAIGTAILRHCLAVAA